jgi:hypothetical protein
LLGNIFLRLTNYIRHRFNHHIERICGHGKKTIPYLLQPIKEEQLRCSCRLRQKYLGTEVAASLKGTDLELLAETIAPLPKQLATLIKDKSTLMLRLKRELREKETSLHLFEKKIKDKKTGETVEYRPKACRKESPVTYSNLLEGDPKLEEIKTQFKTIT